MGNYFNDDSLPAKGFSGDESSSDIFAEGDVVGASSTTSERVVDTQSGYLVVLKRLDGTRSALSVKRRVGTPPSSYVMLTPDEQVKLAKILAEAKTHASRVPPQTQRWTKSLSRKTRAAGEDETFKFDGEPEKEFERVRVQRQEEFEQMRSGTKRSRSLPVAQILAVVAGLVLIPLAGFFAFTHLIGGQKTQTSPAARIDALPAADNDARVDKFVRSFVAAMLDFSPATYKSSQIQAMAVMTPQLLERYWKETNFPLSKQQLAAVPKGQTLLITKVIEQDLTDNTTNVDLYAELASANNKISTPVHLALKVATESDGTLRVVEQKDLSSVSK